MSTDKCGRFHLGEAKSKVPRTEKGIMRPSNGFTQRPEQLIETHPTRLRSSTLQHANLKALRLFRHICRMLPFIIKVHEIKHRVTPIQAKRYVANHFRQNCKLTDLVEIDDLIEHGYKTIFEAQMHYSNTGYLYKYIMPWGHKMRDHGVDRFEEQRGEKLNKEPATKFLKGFYQGRKSHYV